MSGIDNKKMLAMRGAFSWNGTRECAQTSVAAGIGYGACHLWSRDASTLKGMNPELDGELEWLQVPLAGSNTKVSASRGKQLGDRNEKVILRS